MQLNVIYEHIIAYRFYGMAKVQRTLQENDQIAMADTVVILRFSTELRRNLSIAKRPSLTDICDQNFGWEMKFGMESEHSSWSSIQIHLDQIPTVSSQIFARKIAVEFSAAIWLPNNFPKSCDRIYDRNLVAK